MKRVFTIAAVLLMFGTYAAWAGQPSQPPITVSIRPALDVPTPFLPGGEMVTLGGGANVAATYALPFFRLISVGVDLGYHYTPLIVTEFSTPGSLSAISGSLMADFRLVFLRRMELCVFLSGGYFFAFLNDEPAETGHFFYADGGLGIAYRISPRVSLGVQGRLTNFLGLYSSFSAIVCLDMRFGR